MKKNIFRHILSLNLKFLIKSIAELSQELPEMWKYCFFHQDLLLPSGYFSDFMDSLAHVFYGFLNCSCNFIRASGFNLCHFHFQKKVRDSYRRIRILVAKLIHSIGAHYPELQLHSISEGKRTIDEFEIINRDHTNQNIRSVFIMLFFFRLWNSSEQFQQDLLSGTEGQVVQNTVSVR